ncbi:MAG: YicC family protein [Leptospirillia bacterium]
MSGSQTSTPVSLVSSMTGFADMTLPSGYRIQIRSWNHRSLETVFRVPSEWEAIEPSMRKLLTQKLSRGRVDVTVSRSDGSGRRLNSFLEKGVRAYGNLTLLSQHLGLKEEVRLEHILSVLSTEGFQEIPTLDETASLDHFSRALDALILSRQREGESLREVLLALLSQIRGLSGQIDSRRKSAKKEIRRQFLDRMKSYLKEIEADPGKRFEEEALLYLAKKDNEEEWKRFHIHLAQTEREMEKGGLLGRSLDFLAQEMNRELTTFISKEPWPDLFQPAMEIRNILSSFREQVQNLE